MKIIFEKVKNQKYTILIFHINNEHQTRKFSVNTKKFTLENHNKWLKKILKNKKEIIYLARVKNQIVGLIRCKNYRKRNYLSWAVKKSFRGKGIGKKMLKKFLEKNKKSFFAKIKKQNYRSLKICESAGFKKFRENSNFKFYLKSKFYI